MVLPRRDGPRLRSHQELGAGEDRGEVPGPVTLFLDHYLFRLAAPFSTETLPSETLP